MLALPFFPTYNTSWAMRKVFSRACYPLPLPASHSSTPILGVPFGPKAWLHSRPFLVLPRLISVQWWHIGCLPGWILAICCQCTLFPSDAVCDLLAKSHCLRYLTLPTFWLPKQDYEGLLNKCEPATWTVVSKGDDGWWHICRGPAFCLGS